MEADYQAGMVVFNGEVELTPLQRRMAEGHDQMLTIGTTSLIRLGRLCQTQVEHTRSNHLIHHCQQTTHL
jgi:hypothetical protein